MKVLYIHNVTPDSKQANLIQVMAMCKAMANLGNHVDLSLIKKRRGSSLNLIQDKFTYNIHYRNCLFSNKRIDKYLNRNAIKKVIFEVKPDLLYIRHPVILWHAQKTKIPVILELHNNIFYNRFSWVNSYWNRMILKAVKQNIIKTIVCISYALTEYWIRSGISEKKIVTAHDGVDFDIFKNSISQLEARNKLNLPHNQPIITYSGRLYKNRNIDHILTLAKSFPQVLFLVVGGPEKQKLYYEQFAKAEDVNNILFIGQVPHKRVNDYLFASDILLALWSSNVSTINYCSPLKIFEYMATGRIIVANGFPTILEVLKHNYNAIICTPDSQKDLEKKVHYALKMSYPNYMADKAREDAFENYTWANRAKLILEHAQSIDSHF